MQIGVRVVVGALQHILAAVVQVERRDAGQYEAVSAGAAVRLLHGVLIAWDGIFGVIRTGLIAVGVLRPEVDAGGQSLDVDAVEVIDGTVVLLVHNGIDQAN